MLRQHGELAWCASGAGGTAAERQLSCLIIETSAVAGETSASTPHEWLKSSSLAGSLTRAMTRGTLKRFWRGAR